MKILLVDDDQGILECCALVIDHMHERHEVVTATSVSEALALLQQNDFDAVVTDYLFTDARFADGRSGGDLLDVVAARQPRVRRMIFSAAVVPAGVAAHIVLDKMAGMDAFVACSRMIASSTSRLRCEVRPKPAADASSTVTARRILAASSP